MALPFALKYSGVVVGSLMLIGVGIVSAYSAYLLLMASKFNEHTKSYKGLADAGGNSHSPPPLSSSIAIDRLPQRAVNWAGYLLT